MSATSVTEVGLGASGNDTKSILNTLNSLPKIVKVGEGEIVDGEVESSPPSNPSVLITFDPVLPLSKDNYVIMLTTISGGVAYVTDKTNDADGKFESFEAMCETECTVMYAVIEK